MLRTIIHQCTVSYVLCITNVDRSQSNIVLSAPLRFSRRHQLTPTVAAYWPIGVPEVLNWEQTGSTAWRRMHQLIAHSLDTLPKQAYRLAMVTTIADLAFAKLYSYNRRIP